MPPIQGKIMDSAGTATAFIVPAVCLALVTFYALFDLRTRRARRTAGGRGSALMHVPGTHARLPSVRHRAWPSGSARAESRTEPVTVGLIVKRNTNPFWVTMKDTAEQTADDDNVKLLTAAGKSDIDNASQVAALAKMTATAPRAS